MARRYAESDEDGSHPFQDDGLDLPPPVENESPTAAAYFPHGYEEHRAPRGWAIFLMALFGFVILIFFSYLRLHPADLLACTTSLPAFFLGRSDLKSMRAGAMRREKVGLTRVGTWMGGLVSLASIGLGLQLFFMLLWRTLWSWL